MINCLNVSEESFIKSRQNGGIDGCRHHMPKRDKKKKNSFVFDFPKSWSLSISQRFLINNASIPRIYKYFSKTSRVDHCIESTTNMSNILFSIGNKILN